MKWAFRSDLLIDSIQSIWSNWTSLIKSKNKIYHHSCSAEEHADEMQQVYWTRWNWISFPGRFFRIRRHSLPGVHFSKTVFSITPTKWTNENVHNMWETLITVWLTSCILWSGSSKNWQVLPNIWKMDPH